MWRRASRTGCSVSALAALAARTVGRRVELAGGLVGTVTRVTGSGYVVTVRDLTSAHVKFLDD
jgi:preprotein translocase subunit YajC